MRSISTGLVALFTILFFTTCSLASATFDISISPSESARVYPGEDYEFRLDLGVDVVDQAGDLLVLFVKQTGCQSAECYEILARERLEPGNHSKQYVVEYTIPCDLAAGEFVWFLIEFSTGEESWRPHSDPGWIVKALPAFTPEISVSPRVPIAGTAFTLTAELTFPLPVEEYEWSLDGDVVSTAQTYSGSLNEGLYEIGLRVLHPCTGDWSQSTLSLEVSAESVPPEGNPIVPLQSLVLAELVFDASSVDDPDGGEIESFVWDFGDGNTVEGATVRHAYTLVDSYDVKLTVCDDDGDCSEWDFTVEIQERPIPALNSNVAMLFPDSSTIVSTDADGQPPLGVRLQSIDDFEPPQGGSEFGGMYEWGASEHDPTSTGVIRYVLDETRGGHVALDYENNSWLKLQLSRFPHAIDASLYDGLVVTFWIDSEAPSVDIQAEILCGGKGFTFSYFSAETELLTFYIPFAGFKEYGANSAEGIPDDELAHVSAIGFFPQNQSGSLYISELAFYWIDEAE